MSVPQIPARLITCPSYNGLVVPYITARHTDRPEWGTHHPHRSAHIWNRRLCQICGQALEECERVVIYARPVDFGNGVSPEPGMHPECAAYSRLACPMLAGRIKVYHRAPRRRCGDPGCECRHWNSDPHAHNVRANHPAEAWYAAWLPLNRYRIVSHDETGITGPELKFGYLLAVRKIRDAAVDDPQAYTFDRIIGLHRLLR